MLARLRAFLGSPKLHHEVEQVAKAYAAALVATGVLTSSALTVDGLRAAAVAALFGLIRQIPDLFPANPGPVVAQIPETPVEGKSLGRHVHHDPRSFDFLAVGPDGVARSGVPVTTKMWTFPGKPLDQKALGSCTGNATTHLLRVRSGKATGLTESVAVKVYERATQIDASPGAYPPDDTGSDGLSALKAAQQLGLYSGAYRWCKGLDDVLAVLSQHGPVIIGIPWYEGFDHPGPNGLLSISGSVRGGHEVCLHGVDASAKTVIGVNSWGASWGPLHGHFSMSWDTLGKLLANQGDAATIEGAVTASGVINNHVTVQRTSSNTTAKGRGTPSTS